MVEKTVSAFDARRKFGKVLDRVAGGRDSVIVERHGEPVAAVIPIAVYRQMQQQRNEARVRLRQRFEETSARANMSPEDADTLITEVVAEVRAARRTAEQGKEAGA